MSRVIRGGKAKVVAAEVVEAKESAAEILEQARAKAAAIVEAAQAEADTLRERARVEGAEAGRAEAAALLAQTHARRQALLEEAEAALGTLAAQAARKVVRAELALAPERVADIARDLLDRVRRAREIRVRVAAADAERVRPLLPAHAHLEVSDALQPGDVVLETEVGELDARIDVQLAALERALSDS